MDQGTDLHEVHMAIAKAGHDTEMHRATDEAYDNLHACCKYERE
jgi:periplasmic mercuric ion binding protein